MKDSKQDEETPALTFAQIKNTCCCCGKNHKVTDCPVRNSIPKEQWHIHKAKEVEHYNQIAEEIRRVLANDEALARNASASSTAPTTPSSNATVAGGTTSEDWTMFTLNQVSTPSEDYRELMTLDSGSTKGHDVGDSILV